MISCILTTLCIYIYVYIYVHRFIRTSYLRAAVPFWHPRPRGGVRGLEPCASVDSCGSLLGILGVFMFKGKGFGSGVLTIERSAWSTGRRNSCCLTLTVLPGTFAWEYRSASTIISGQRSTSTSPFHFTDTVLHQGSGVDHVRAGVQHTRVEAALSIAAAPWPRIAD